VVNDTPNDSETIRLLENRVSIRRYAESPVEDATLEAVLHAGCRAPTPSNIQAYSVVAVRDPERKQTLATLAGNQEHVAKAPVFLAFCADLSRVARACDIHDLPPTGLGTMEMGLTGAIDAALVGMAMMLAAESLGLGCVMIGGLRNKPLEVADCLRLPPRAAALFGMCLGWPEGRPPQKPRFPLEGVVHFEEYNSDSRDRVLLHYDGLLADHYDAQNRPTDRASWTKRIAEDFSAPRRTHMRESLRILGFDFT
jgi:nitroreductase